MKRSIPACFLAVLLCGAAVSGYGAEEEELRVGVFENPPFVIRSAGGWSGMAAELWETTAARLHLPFRWVPYDSLAELVQAGESGECDILVTNLAVTSDRARRLKFSFPWYDSGLRLLVRAPEERSTWLQLLHSGHIYTYGILFIVLVLLAVLVTEARRRHERNFTHSWRDGFTGSLAEVISVAKSGDLPNRRLSWQVNVLVSVWMMFGMGMLAYVTSSVTNAMRNTARGNDDGTVRELADLPGRQVGVLNGSGAEVFLGRLGLTVHPFNHENEAAEAVSRGELDAFAADAAVLQFYAVTHPEARTAVTGQIFSPYKFAFAAGAARAELLDYISVELIQLLEDGTVQRLYSKYFGRIGASGGQDPSGGLPRAVHPSVSAPSRLPGILHD